MSDKPDPKTDPNNPNNKVKLDWLKAVTGTVQYSEQNMADLNNRAAGQRAIEALDEKKALIREVMLAAEFEVKGGVGGSKTMKLLDENGDYRKEIDTVHHGPDLINSVADPAPLQRAYDEILKVEKSLENNPYYFPPEPEYTQVPIYDLDGLGEEELKEKLAEIEDARRMRELEMRAYALEKAEADKHLAEDLWHPLVREGIIPENLVPQQHSSVAQLFAAATEQYDERLQEYSKDLTEKDILKEKFDLGFKIAGATLKLAGAANTLGSEIGSLQDNSQVVANTEEVAEFFGHVETALAIGQGLTTAALTDKDFTNVGQTIADEVFASIQSEMPPEAAAIVGSCLANGARMVNVSKKVKAGEYEEAFEDLVNGIANELEKYDPQGKEGLMSAISTQLVQAVTSGKSMTGFVKALADPNSKPSDIMREMMGAAVALGSEAGADVPSTKLDVFSDTVIAMQAAKEELDGATAKVNDKFTMEDLEAMRKKKAEIEERQKEADVRSAELAKESAEQKMREQEEDFEVLLRTGLSKPTTDEEEIDLQEYLRSESIEQILAIQAKNDATFKFCETIAKKGVAFVKSIFPPAGIAEAAMTLALTIKDAVEKAEQLIIWRENVEDALTAHSAQADAMLNRKGLQTKQTTQAGIQVALDAAKVVAEVLALTPAAPAAPVVKASISVTEAAIELSDLIYTEAQLAAAWKTFQKAKDDPRDRYLARKAMRDNPTLSKYAMAYGALKGDPIAVEGMRRCGLSKVTLANPDTNVNKVVNYLEARYPEDPVLLRAVPVPDKWYPGPIALSTRCWMTFYQTAIASADLSETSDTSGIAAAIARVEEAEQVFDKALDRAIDEAKQIPLADSIDNPVIFTQQSYAPFIAACMRLQDQLRGYSPKQSDGMPHKSMEKFADALAAKSEQKVAGINQVLKDEPWKKFHPSASESPSQMAENAIKSGQITDPLNALSESEETDEEDELVRT